MSNKDKPIIPVIPTDSHLRLIKEIYLLFNNEKIEDCVNATANILAYLIYTNYPHHYTNVLKKMYHEMQTRMERLEKDDNNERKSKL